MEKIETVENVSFSIRLENPKYRIKIAEGIEWVSFYKMPNLFHRTMMRLVFGWKFEVFQSK